MGSINGDQVIRKAPSSITRSGPNRPLAEPWTGNTRTPDASPSNPTRIPPGTGGIKPSRDRTPPPVQSWTGSDRRNAPIGGGAGSASTPVPVIRDRSRGREFSTPLTEAPRNIGASGQRRFIPAAAPIPAPPAENLRVAVNVGVAAGIGFSSSHWYGHNWINFSFGNWCGNYEPYAYPGYSWCRPRYYGAYGFDPYRHCNPWGGYYYVRRYPYYPFTYWYPGYTVSVNACGPWFRVSYHRPFATWLVNFNYCNTPCETFNDCALVTPVVAAPPAAYCFSSENIYRYTYVNPIAAEVPYSPATVEVLPAPATEAELAHTTGRELGDTYMRLGDEASAIRVYTAHTDRHPGDVRALRSLGVALIQTGQVEQGVAMVQRSYLIDPGLAGTIFDRELLRDANHLTDVLDKVTALATQLDGKPEAASAWLTVAMFMQADGRIAPARAALDKAKAAGLNARVVEELQAALPLANS